MSHYYLPVAKHNTEEKLDRILRKYHGKRSDVVLKNLDFFNDAWLAAFAEAEKNQPPAPNFENICFGNAKSKNDGGVDE